jgi:hypothetical protein
MPKSSVGPGTGQLMVPLMLAFQQHTSRVVAGRQKDTAGRLPYPDDVTGGWCTQDAILADQELLDAIRSTNLGDQLSDLGVPVPAITTNNKEGSSNALGDRLKDASYEGLGVVVLLENLDFLTETRTKRNKS